MFQAREPQESLWQSEFLITPRKAKLMRRSWAEVFRNEVLVLIEEERFAPMYSCTARTWAGRTVRCRRCWESCIPGNNRHSPDTHFGPKSGSNGVFGRSSRPSADVGQGKNGGERTQQETLAPGGVSWRGVRLAGWRVSSGRAQSGWEWNGSQSGQGATGLILPRPALGKMQGDPACRAGEPSGEGEEPPPEGLGGHDLLDSPMRAVQQARLWAITWAASQAALAAKRPEGRWFSPTPYLRSRIAFSISAWRRWSASSSRVCPSRSVMKP